MKNIISFTLLLFTLVLMPGCADNSFEEHPQDDDFPFQLVLESDEGSDLPNADDFGLEISIADYLPERRLPSAPVTLQYAINDLEGDMVGNVVIDKIVYEVELDDCVYERALDFISDENDLSGTIHITPDNDLGSIPASFEIIFTLPGLPETSGSFSVAFSSLQSPENIQLGSPNVFEYKVLDSDVAGDWQTELGSVEEFENFKSIFGSLNPELEKLDFEDITGNLKAEFEFEEMKFILELEETEEVATCEDGEIEIEIANRVIEIEADYDAEDGEVEFEGSHEIENEEGLVEDELDFIIEAVYAIESEEKIIIRFFSVIDEDHFSEGDELFRNEDGVSLTFTKD